MGLRWSLYGDMGFPFGTWGPCGAGDTLNGAGGRGPLFIAMPDFNMLAEVEIEGILASVGREDGGFLRLRVNDFETLPRGPA